MIAATSRVSAASLSRCLQCSLLELLASYLFSLRFEVGRGGGNSIVHGYQHRLDRRAMAGQLQTFGTLENASAKLVYPSTLTYKERASLAKSDAVEYCRWGDLSGLLVLQHIPAPDI